ncbi:HTTM domain-containing protein [Streptomyces nitrosporeus]|uniref:HTTM domain-containing protein n=1 Tax=Streptomyces nitrosporeus TaxID=28894 RepID=A0A5J6FAX1_9ACTN|nr:HTTM domain-containing protein [Streptomyces nitrosporeus]QEU73518.1 HTTM domain-containing protein [Streptomyces nitrosporeus]GGZ03980.1 HTTM domain-containing protein [Streptomyces nitrosporeus]
MSTPPPAAAHVRRRTFAHAVQRVTTGPMGTYQSAVLRIGVSATYLLFLLRELPHRHELYGPDSPWRWDMARRLISGNEAFTALMWSDSSLWFETVYVLTLVASALLLVGWRTRATAVLFMIGVLSLQNRSIFMGDGGDNVIHLMAIYLLLTRCARVWSLDARREARKAAHEAEGRAPVPDITGPVLWALLGCVLLPATVVGGFGGTWWLPALLWVLWLGNGIWWAVNRLGPGHEVRTLLDVLANIAHHGALFVIMAEVCLIYATAGWYKIQGSLWQDGTALYYPLKLDYFTPWQGVSDLLASSALIVLALTYVTVIVQVAFPFTLLNRKAKNVLLVLMIGEHAGIAVLLGLPFFSMAMISVDAVFLPTVFLVWLGDKVSRGRHRLLGRPKAGAALPGPRSPAGPAAPESLEGDAPRHGGGSGHTLVE